MRKTSIHAVTSAASASLRLAPSIVVGVGVGPRKFQGAGRRRPEECPVKGFGHRRIHNSAARAGSPSPFSQPPVPIAFHYRSAPPFPGPGFSSSCRRRSRSLAMLPWLPPTMLFFVFSAASSVVPLLMLAAAAEVRQGGPLCQPTLCGGFNISSPLGIVDDHATAASCGEIGFQVVCVNNATPYLGHNHEYNSLQILDIFYDNHSLVVADVPKVQIFNNIRSCHISESSNTSSKVGAPFAISPANQNLILYNCTEAPPPAAREGLAETVCGNGTFVRVAHEPASNRSAGGYYGSYFLEGCKATVVPVLGGYGDVDATNYKELITDGFLLTWSPPPLPPPRPAGN
ncbi:hypothetical protein BS78_03G073100 [Paspalum vaginatum]|nr:hypothetical protein BS78_03G073100 [Paspalum vaginatum]